MLYMVGLGLGEQDISFSAREAVKKADKIFLDVYTSPFLGDVSHLENLLGKEIILADRKLVELESDKILDKGKTIVFLVVGDVFSATTHSDLWLRAKEKGMEIKVFHNASILTAVGETGLSLYKFGKTASIPFPREGSIIETPYLVLKENKDAHTLFLLDLKEEVMLTANEAIEVLLSIEKIKRERVFSEKTLCVVCCALGTERQKIVCGKAKELLKKKLNVFPQVLIVPGSLHFVEEEVLSFYRV